MFIDVGSKLSVAWVIRYIWLATLYNALTLLLPAMNILDPSGIVIKNHVVNNGWWVIRLEGKNGLLLSPFIMAGWGLSPLSLRAGCAPEILMSRRTTLQAIISPFIRQAMKPLRRSHSVIELLGYIHLHPCCIQTLHGKHHCECIRLRDYLVEGDGGLDDMWSQDAWQFFTTVKNNKVWMNMACQRTEVGVRWKMSFVIALIDVWETTNRFLQRRCRKNVVPISWFYENLNDLQSIS